ncbi:AAA family ATPase [Grimontia marina]|uniref:Denitrification regulatory protein NirQ n=1 Tax=Grimontia marina TaxID=646534 RepID=A0A128F0X4_9GAMM|nr:MoxR family ATPase [Grimontia marina]CZF80070.1 Denitrification regulatory protein NirQ [Grimontia marina]
MTERQGQRETDFPQTVMDIRHALKAGGYICDKSLAFSLSLMKQLERPLLLEGEAGVGKTSVATQIAASLGRPLIRLQCYEGLSVSQTLYEWNYQRQLLSIRLLEKQQDIDIEGEIYAEKYLLERPLLKAMRTVEPSVLLIDEIDRADQEFEAFLLELLGEFQVTIPEIGTLKAKSSPLVILTSNGTRTLSDALRRRCLYHYIDYPTAQEELAIVVARIPDIDIRLAEQISRFVQALRRRELKKVPGIAETLDWAEALLGLEYKSLDDNLECLHLSLTCLLKHKEDRFQLTTDELEKLVVIAK